MRGWKGCRFSNRQTTGSCFQRMKKWMAFILFGRNTGFNIVTVWWTPKKTIARRLIMFSLKIFLYKKLPTPDSPPLAEQAQLPTADQPPRSLSPASCRAALFIMLYRGYPMLQMPFQLLNALLEIDEQLSSWRYRHMNMVHRMIGARIGTGGSSGKDYLKAAADRHYIFKEIAQLNSFLIERRRLPELPEAIQKRLGFVST